MAVIHPTAKKQKAKPPTKEAELWLIGASPERQPRPKRKEIPEELMRARDLEPQGARSRTTNKSKSKTPGKAVRKLNPQQKKKLQELHKASAEAENFMKSWFGTVKKILDLQPNEKVLEAKSQTVFAAKEAVKNKRFCSFLYEIVFMNSKRVDKGDFCSFIKAFDKELKDDQSLKIFSYLTGQFKMKFPNKEREDKKRKL